MANDLFGPITLPRLVGTNDLADLLGITTRRLHQLVREGMPKEARGSFDLKAAVGWYLNELKGGSSRAQNVDEQRRELLFEQTVKTRLENEQNRARLIPAELVAGVHNRMAAELAANLDALAPRMAGNLAGISDPAEIKTLLFDESRRIRDQFAVGIMESVSQHVADLDNQTDEAGADEPAPKTD